MIETMMNGRWPIVLPEHRAARPVNDWWEAQRLAATYSRITSKNHPKVLDIGAEEGDFPCLYSMWGAEVFLVEPNPKAWPWIKATFEANNQIPAGWMVGLLGSQDQVNQIGLPWSLVEDLAWAWPDAAHDLDPTPEHGFHHLAEHGAVSGIIEMDDCVIRAWGPDIITMDIEGGELHCLRGAELTLAEVRPELFISIHPDFMRDLYGQDPAALYAMLEAADYRVQFLCQDHEVHIHAVHRSRVWPWGDPHDHTKHA